jgi:hypothetical protein
MKGLRKFFATFFLTRWMFAYACRECGESVVKLTREDLTEQQKLDLEKSGGAWYFDKYAYRCTNPECPSVRKGSFDIIV